MQGARNVTQLLKHMRANSTVGKLAKIAISWLQKWAGIGCAVLENPEIDIPPTSAKYLESIRSFLKKCDASIILGEKPRVMREYNSYIMDHVLNSNMSRFEINMVNKTRLYLQVETVAEISNPEGTKIDPAWTQEGEKPSWSTDRWPKVGKPSKLMWRTWRKALKIIAQQDGYLRQRLGR
jgi:hypothetical protein